MIKSVLNIALIWFSFFCNCYLKSQTFNLVQNGSFEDFNNCSTHVKYWTDADTNSYNYATQNYCLNNIPGGTSSDYQYPRTGRGYVATTFFNPQGYKWFNRGYLRNKLSTTLTLNTQYCVKFFINVRNYSPSGIDAIGAYFGDATLDTIKYGNTILNYLPPQVSNPTGNIITDTLNWIKISGTFIAKGTEKYLVIGNFKSDTATNFSQIYPTRADTGCDLLVEDVSVMEYDLPAFAGRDTSLLAGDSVYLGRPREFAMDEICQWFKLPNTTTAFDTVAGLWVKPNVATTYIVRQEICGNVKWDTVMVYMNPQGLNEKMLRLNQELMIYPNPANEFIELSTENTDLLKEINSIKLFNALGELMQEDELRISTGKGFVNVSALNAGWYTIELKSKTGESVNKRFVIQR